MKRLTVLGVTGSVGRRTLELVEQFPDEFRLEGMAARGSDPALVAELCARHRPRVLALTDPAAVDRVARAISAPLPEILTGPEGLVTLAGQVDADIVLSAIVGGAGLLPTMAAIQSGKAVALANKETLVMAGELMTRAAEQSGAELLPVDSEHNALHQCLRGEKRSEVRRIVLTASGGPFRTKDKAAMSSATVAEAMKHPTWNMGAKITIDSATLMNKGLEVIEAHWLFGFSADEINIVVHPESVVHSMIEMIDGSVIAQMGVTDMRHAIQYALTYPERCPSELAPLDLTKLSSLHFEEPDLERFPCVSLAYRALQTGGTLPAAMNAANEEAVHAFIDERISLSDIPLIIRAIMDDHKASPVKVLEDVLNADRSARQLARRIINQLTAAPRANVA